MNGQVREACFEINTVLLQSKLSTPQVRVTDSQKHRRYRFPSFAVDRHHRTNSSLYLFLADVPDAPGRPLVTGFTSRSIDLSWAKPRKQSKEAPITGYSIVTG